MQARWTFPAVVWLCFFAVEFAYAQVSPSKPVSAKDPAFQSTLEKLIQSGKPADMDQAFTLLKQKFAENPKTAEPILKDLKNLLATLMAQTNHADDMLDIITSAKRAKPVKNAAGQLNAMGYLWAMQVIVFYRNDKPAEAKAAFDDAFFKDMGKDVSGDIIKFWPQVFKAAEKREEYAALLQTIMLNCWDSDTVELALKRRIEVLNSLNKPQDALADSKRLFIAASMPHTATAILVVDKQLAITDKSKTQPFRDQQTAGAAAPSDPMNAAAAHKCPVLLDISLDALTPDKDALEAQGDGTAVDALLHPAMVYLLCGQPDQALKIAQAASPQATDPHDADSVNAMIAKCMKAQDGTVGRTNAYLATKPSAATPVASTPKTTKPPKASTPKPPTDLP